MPNTQSAILTAARSAYHKRLIEEHVLYAKGTMGDTHVFSNADKGNEASRCIAALMARELGIDLSGIHLSEHPPKAGQTVGSQFEKITMDFLQETFPLLQNIRPGMWDFFQLGNNGRAGQVSDTAQYEHLSYLAELATTNKALSVMLGNDYMVSPDVVIYRRLYSDDALNTPLYLVDEHACLRAALREKNGGKPLLHASISMKWTMRSDRAQNTRTEALNLIRNRKGHLPHIVAVTGEPLPSRLASLALGTGDIDCMYHFALDELLRAVKEYAGQSRGDIEEQLLNLVEGRRLKDISDLPLDLGV